MKTKLFQITKPDRELLKVALKELRNVVRNENTNEISEEAQADLDEEVDHIEHLIKIFK